MKIMFLRLAQTEAKVSDLEDVDNISLLELKPKADLKSCFVQTISGLEKESLKGKSKKGKEKGKVVNKKGQNNRKGQRARQQTWEKIHGKSAKHLLKKKVELSLKETKGANEQNNAETQHSLKRKSDEESLHPSREAKKKKITRDFEGRIQRSTKNKIW